MPPEVNFPSDDYLAKLFGTDCRTFHRTIKPIILQDNIDILKKSNSENPDIGIDADFNIYLRPTNGSEVINTGLKVSDYKADL